MFARYGGFIYRFRRCAIMIWLFLFVIGLFFALKIQSVLTDPPFVAEHAESTLGENLLHDRFQAPSQSLVVWIKDSQNSLMAQTDQQALDRLSAKLRELPHVQSASPPVGDQIAGNTAYMPIALNANLDQVRRLLPNIQEVLRETSQGSLHMQLAGSAVFVEAEDQASVHDLSKVEKIALPLTLLVLLVVFNTWPAAGLPLLTAIVSTVGALAVLYGLGTRMQLSVFVLNIPTTVGLAVSIDYSLLLVNRFREELQTYSVAESVSRTLATSGRSIFYSGLLVMFGILSLAFFDNVVFRSVMWAGLLVIALNVLGSLTLIPALLGVVGERINRGALWKRKRKEPMRFGWMGFAKFVMRHSTVTMLVAVLLLALMISQIWQARFGIPGLEALPASYSARQTMEALHQTFGKHTFEPVRVVLQKQEGTILQNANTVQTLRQYVDWLSQQKEVGKVTSVFSAVPSTLSAKQVDSFLLHPPDSLRNHLQTLAKGNVTHLKIDLKIDPESASVVQFLDLVRAHVPTGYLVYISGLAAVHHDFDASVLQRLPAALVYVFAVTFVVLLLVFRSVVLPLKAILMNVLSLLATFGVLIWIFVEGHGLAFLHVGNTTVIDTFVPVFVFAFVFGTSMDYEVFMLSRIQEEYQAGYSNEEATCRGLAVTSRLITSAAMILFLHTGAFSLTDVLPVKQIGLGLAIAIAIDATLVRLFLVPVLMKWLGEWNWKYFKWRSMKESS